MAKKDKNSSDSFNNPFSGLKGLSVSSQQKTPVTSNPRTKVEQPKPPPQVTQEPLDSSEQFAREMGQLGVKVLEQDDFLEKEPSVSADTGIVNESTSNSGPENNPAGSRRQARKIVRRMGEPESTLDLHGIAAADAVRKVEWFLENAIFHGCRFVRIVTGKGVHSAGGPVIKPLVEEYLSGPGRRFVVAWVQAPNNQGGAGAILVEVGDTND